MIKISNLSKSFGNFKALENLNINVRKGEIYGFIGPNGCRAFLYRLNLGLGSKGRGFESPPLPFLIYN
ncbi:MAG: hypothetical protein ACFFAN_16615 [Promethearchaeota archaeon]